MFIGVVSVLTSRIVYFIWHVLGTVLTHMLFSSRIETIYTYYA